MIYYIETYCMEIYEQERINNSLNNIFQKIKINKVIFINNN